MSLNAVTEAAAGNRNMIEIHYIYAFETIRNGGSEIFGTGLDRIYSAV